MGIFDNWSGEKKVQSPYLYLQAAGSDGSDGTAKGFHLRWALIRNLGETHLPKGNKASTSVNFNRSEDFVHVFRSLYTQRFPTIIDFSSTAPDLVHNAYHLWVFHTTNPASTIYVRFHDHGRYDDALAGFDPSTNTLDFLKKYGEGLIEVEVKDKLFFAAEFGVTITGNQPTLKTEAVSVKENIALPELFVSCRKRFTKENWCKEKGPEGDVGIEISYGRPGVPGEEPPNDEGRYVPPCCQDSKNLLPNGNFEKGLLGFETDYNVEGGSGPGRIYITGDAKSINAVWQGRPREGKRFLAVDGATNPKTAVWRKAVKVEPGQNYCFSGWICTLYERYPAKIEIQIKGHKGVLLATKIVKAPSKAKHWEYFSVECEATNCDVVFIEIIDLSKASIGNDFGLDLLWLCRARQKKCQPRIVSENIRSVRFTITQGFLDSIEFEAYEDYINGAKWQDIDKYSLTTDTNTAFQRLEKSANLIHGKWQKFNDGATVNVANYQDRWARSSGIKEAVTNYIALSDSDPFALNVLLGQIASDGQMEASLLDMLQIVSLDYHVARMLGLGDIDTIQPAKTEPYLHLAVYFTSGELDDNDGARDVGHAYMSVPTTLLDSRLPESPTLFPVQYGLIIDNAGQSPPPITDANGYTPDGQTRFVNLFIDNELDDTPLGPFFQPPDEFCEIEKTGPVFFGVEYRKQGEATWSKPEIAHDENYLDAGSPPKFETMQIPNSGEQNTPLFSHQETENGVHEYSVYGVNWFSRASSLGNIRPTDVTNIVKPNTLLPPANFRAQLIQEESPRLLTTATEQTMLGNLGGPDKTLIRLTFDYFHTHDLNYDFADKVEVFFRQDAPKNSRGAIKSVEDDLGNDQLATVRTEPYWQNSTGQSIDPALAVGLMSQFVGGVFSSEQKSWVIMDVASSVIPGEGPIFTIKKRNETIAEDPGSTGQYISVQTPVLPNSGSTFLAIENLADPASWGVPNPLSKTIEIGDPSWTVVTKTYIQDGETISQDLRGIWALADISDLPDQQTGDIVGVYEIQFQSYNLANHSQTGDQDPVNWHNGVVRIAMDNDPNGPKKVLEVIKVENIGAGQPLLLVAVDNAFDALDPILTGPGIQVNYYPGYIVYLHADTAHGLTEANILPAVGSLSRKTWMSVGSHDTVMDYHSRLGVPALVLALGKIEPLPPEAPNGGDYATPPDFYFKSTYAFTVQFTHDPYSFAFYRTSEDAILRALYSDATLQTIRAELANLGDDDPYRADRLKNLVSFDYVYNDPAKPFFDPSGTNPNNTFRRFPRDSGNFRFPPPNLAPDFDGTKEPGLVLEAVRKAVLSTFTPLTEQPLLYQFIKTGGYQPQPKPQTIRDEAGNLLDQSDPRFDQAPMAKRLGASQVQFVDFTLDGASNNLYFYMGREIGSLGKMSDPSPISGPVFLVNARPPVAPGIKKLFTVPASESPPVSPRVCFEINRFPYEQKVAGIEIYRTTSSTEALSVRMMSLVKTVDLETDGFPDAPSYKIHDDFEDGFIPFGDPLFYRIVALRKITDKQGQLGWAPSQPSKLLATSVVDSINPAAPELGFTSSNISGNPTEATNIVINWLSEVYNGKYYLEKLNNAGIWKTIFIVKTNSFPITVDLAATDLGSNTLLKEATNGRPIYHKFRVRVENSAGLFNLEDKVLKI